MNIINIVNKNPLFAQWQQQLKEGTLFYVETRSAMMVQGYKVPSQISSMVVSGDVATPQGNAPAGN